MTTLLVSARADGIYVTPRRAGLRERLGARLRDSWLDAALAKGASPDANVQLSLRAHRLISQTTRWELASQIRRLLQEAESPSRPCERLVATLTICRRKITEARSVLEEVADALTRPGPVDARGMAQLRLLLTDSAGPLYCRPRADDLAGPLEAALDALDLRF